MADSDTTQQKSFHARLAEPKQMTVSHEAFNELKALAENIWAKAAAREAEAKADESKAAAREAMKKEIAEAKAAAREAQKKAEAAAREANFPFFTTIQWLSVAGLAVSLRALFTPGC